MCVEDARADCFHGDSTFAGHAMDDLGVDVDMLASLQHV